MPAQVNVTSSFDFPLYKLYLRSKFSDTNDFAVVYNVIDKSWSLQDISCDCISGAIINGIQYSVFSPYSSTNLYQTSNDSYSYGGNYIPFEYLGKSYAMGDDVDFKRFTQIEISGEAVPDEVVEYKIYVEGELRQEGEFVITPIYSSTIGSTTFGSTTLGSNSDNITFGKFNERIEMWEEGRNISLYIRTKGMNYIKIENASYQYKLIQAYPIH